MRQNGAIRAISLRLPLRYVLVVFYGTLSRRIRHTMKRIHHSDRAQTWE